MPSLHHIVRIMRQSDGQLVQDAAGVAALAVMLVVGLHMPVLI